MSSPSEESGIDLFLEVDEKSLSGADFTAEIIAELRRTFSALHDAGLTQKTISDRLGVSKSAVHRWLHGDGNMTLRKLGELIWAMDCRAVFTLTSDLHDASPVAETDQQPGVLPVSASACDDVTICDADHWYSLTRMDQEAVERFQAYIGQNTAKIEVLGTSNAELIHGCFMPFSQNQAVVNISRRYIPNNYQNIYAADRNIVISTAGGNRSMVTEFNSPLVALSSIEDVA